MRRYYFDLRYGDEITSDEVGLELPSIERVQQEAAYSLADMAKDVFRRDHAVDVAGRQMAIEVRDDDGLVLKARFTFDMDRTRQ